MILGPNSTFLEKGQGHLSSVVTMVHLRNACLCPFGVTSCPMSRSLRAGMHFQVSTAWISFHCITWAWKLAL